ncbi:hypothetical protein BpHYR1_013117 [Brachionus plicatilis]|uniref:Uncharacterized protein n=1 Tax=Brachionus plicatilis TaxID=10195 RepID=A0A3M7Q9J2_BRAPC|nr:hypothetical protein BpHYR1_013117 [Brachionus plicatilis]
MRPNHFALFFFLSFGSVLSSSSKKHQQQLKHAKPNYKTTCSDYYDVFNPHVESRLIMSSSVQASSVSSLSQAYAIFYQQCAQDHTFSLINDSLLEINWKYQFFESPHCIRVDIDFGNVTKFKNSLHYAYYMFSYRELGKANIFLKRNEIIDPVNTLVINRVHLRPYIVCVSFYKQNPQFSENSTECVQMSRALLEDERVHDVELCVDIDTPTHFLSALNSDSHGINGIDRELVMVIFILVLLVLVLVVITIAHYFIKQPRRKYFESIHNYLAKKSSQLNSGNHSAIQSNVGSHSSLVCKEKNHHPAITVTDYSKSVNFQEEPRDTEPLLSKCSPVKNDFKKAEFTIGETIPEESPNNSQVRMDQANKAQEPEENEECIKTISHLLDDKPWSSSQAQFDLNNRHSKSSSLFSANANNNHSNNNSRVHFALES